MGVALKLPAFVLMVWTMYWSLPLANLTGFITAWKLWGVRNDTFEWCHFLVRFLGIRFRKCGSTKLYSDGPCMYLSNHRSWADFFVDAYLTEGRGQLMSRMMVLYVFPMFMLPVTMVRGCICFKRTSIPDKQKFNAWIDSCVAASPMPGICLFPEGHRSRLPKSLPLKRGMLHYAHSRKLPVQVVMSAHKELALDEKTYHVRFGSTCVTGYGQVIRSADYGDFEAFFAALQAEWDRMWLQVFSADPAALPPLRVQPAAMQYPAVLKLSQLVWTLLELALMGLGLALAVYAWLAATSRLAALAGVGGVVLQLAQLAPLLWLVASVVACWDTTLPTPMLAADGSVLREHVVSSRAKKAA